MKMMKAVLEIFQYLNMQQQKSLKALGATLKIIDIWIKFFLVNYDARCEAYINTMKYMFKKIPQTMIK